jgi:hypothetical protein
MIRLAAAWTTAEVEARVGCRRQVRVPGWKAAKGLR